MSNDNCLGVDSTIRVISSLFKIAMAGGKILHACWLLVPPLMTTLRSLALWAAVLPVALSSTFTAAAQDTFDNGNGTASWNDAPNWTDNSIPSSTDDVVFDNSATTIPASVFLDGDQSANSLTFGSANGAPLGEFSLRSNSDSSTTARSLTLATGNITIDSSVTGTQTIGQPGGPMTLNATSGIFTINNNSSQSVMVGAVLSDATVGTTVTYGGTGSGAITVSGTNLYSGATTINSGATVILGNGSALGTTTAGTTVNSGAILNLSGQTVGAENVTLNGAGTGGTAGALTNSSATAASLGGSLNIASAATVNTTAGAINVSGPVTGSGNLTKEGAGVLKLSGANTNTGSTTIVNGTLQVGASNALSNNSAIAVGAGGSSATLDLNGFSDTVGALSGDATGVITNEVAGSAVLSTSVGSGTSTYSGVIQNGAGGAGIVGLTKSGAGTLVLENASNSYTGVTSITGGTLSVSQLANGGVASTIGASSNAASNLVINNGTLQYTGTGVSTDRLFTFNGATIDSAGTGAMNFTNTGALGANGNLTLRANTASGENTLASSISSSRAITKSGDGTWVLSGTNTYTSGTTILEGTLKLGANNAASNSTGSNSMLKFGSSTAATNGILDMAGFNQVSGALSDNGSATAANAVITNNVDGTTSTMTVAARGGTFSGTIKDGGALGTGKVALSFGDRSAQVIAGNNTFSGGTTFGTNTSQVNSQYVTIASNTGLGTGPVTGTGTHGNTFYTLAFTSATPIINNLSTTGGASGNGAQYKNRLVLGNFGTTTDAADGAATTLTINQSQDLTFGGQITDWAATTGSNGGLNSANSDTQGVGNVLKTGTGVLTLTGGATVTTGITSNSTYTGTTTIQEGGIRVGRSDTMPIGTQVFFGSSTTNGHLDLGGFNQQVGGIHVAAGAAAANQIIGNSSTTTDSVLTVGNSNGLDSTYAGTIQDVIGTGNRTLGLTKSGTSVLELTGANTYSGPTTALAGELRLNTTGGQSVGGNLNVSGGVAKLLQGNQINSAKNVSVSSGTFDLQGFNQTVTNVQLTGGTITGTSGVLTSANAYDMQAGSVDAILGGTAGLNKTTTGTVTLTAANTYAGGTNVSGGKLSVANISGSATGTGAVTVSGATAIATLEGTGLIEGAIMVMSEGRIAPGVNSSGTNGNFGGVSIVTYGSAGGLSVDNARFDFDLASTAAAASDQINTNSLNLNNVNNTFTFNLLAGQVEEAVAYRLITTASGISGFDASKFSTTFLNGEAYFATYEVNGNDLMVSFAVIPEPSAFALIAAGFGMLISLQRIRCRV
jgi:fibronectin-binding autotransporter adhesin